MRLFKLILSATLSLVILYVSCRKIDNIDENHDQDIHKFFNSHKATDASIQSICDFVQKENTKLHFVSNIIKQVGFPRWDQAKIFSTSANSKGSSLDSNFIYIPFVRDTQNYVNSFLIIKTTPTDTSHAWKCDWQYQTRKFSEVQDTSVTAREDMALFMLFDKNVFGHDDFMILDKRLYSYQDTVDILTKDLDIENTDIKLSFSNTSRQLSGRNSVWTTLEICQTFYRCVIANNSGKSSVGIYKSNTSRCESGLWYEFEVCSTFWVNLGGSTSGGSEEGSNGNSNGGTNGWNPPNNPCGGASKNQVQWCGPGWTPLGGSGSPPPNNPPNDSTIAEILKKVYNKIQDSADKYWSLAQQYHREYGLTLINVPDTIATAAIPGNADDCNPNMLPNMIGVWHPHHDDGISNNTSDKDQCFNGGDLGLTYQRNVERRNVQISIVTTRNYIYAAYVVDKQLFINYVRSLTGEQEIGAVKMEYYNLHIDGMNTCTNPTTCTWQRKTEVGALAITANNNSSTSGIKIFKSPRNSINFTPLQ